MSEQKPSLKKPGTGSGIGKKRWTMEEMGLRRTKDGVTVEMRDLPLKELHTPQEFLDHPDPPGLVEALTAAMEQEAEPEVRHVKARDLVVRKEHVLPDVQAVYDKVPPMLTRVKGAIPVVELRDGRLLAFDDANSVTAWQRLTPDEDVEVYLVPFDWPEPRRRAASTQRESR